MNTRIVYFDETGDDGNNISSSSAFILTSISMPTDSWSQNYTAFKQFRKNLKDIYGFYASEEMHTKHFLADKDPYRIYGWTPQQKIDILKQFTIAIASLDLSVINVIIDKSKIHSSDFDILSHALTYNIQRIENSSNGDWTYIIITDKGRLAPMRRTARQVRAYNPIPSQFGGFINKPIRFMIEDILEKDSKESYFIQISDFISYFVHLYYKTRYKKENLPGRVGRLIDNQFIGKVMATFSKGNILNEKASSEKYGLVIYSK